MSRDYLYIGDAEDIDLMCETEEEFNEKWVAVKADNRVKFLKNECFLVLEENIEQFNNNYNTDLLPARESLFEYLTKGKESFELMDMFRTDFDNIFEYDEDLPELFYNNFEKFLDKFNDAIQSNLTFLGSYRIGHCDKCGSEDVMYNDNWHDNTKEPIYHCTNPQCDAVITTFKENFTGE